MTVDAPWPANRSAVRLGDLVAQFGGELRGDENRTIVGLATLEDATENELSFLANSRYRHALDTSRAACVLVTAEVAASASPLHALLWVTPDPYVKFAHLSQYFAAARQADSPGIHPSAVIAPSARIAGSARIAAQVVVEDEAEIGEHAVIGAGSVIGRGARVGASTLLHARVTLYAGSVIGERCIVHSGAVIGADGFGFANEDGNWVKIAQTGRTIIGSDVEIGANTTIDRGALADTVVGDGVKLDNQIQIGHNCRIGAHTIIAGCTGVAGSTTIGAHCTIAGAAMIIGHLEIADRVTISVGTVVTHSIKKPGQYTGFFPMAEHASWEKNAVMVRHLAALRERVRKLEKQLKSGEGPE